MIVDYWILRRAELDLADLYKTDGQYAYYGGWNMESHNRRPHRGRPGRPRIPESSSTTPGGAVENPTFHGQPLYLRPLLYLHRGGH